MGTDSFPRRSIKHQPNAKRDESIIIHVEDCQHTQHTIHPSHPETNRRDARTPSRTFGNTQTKKTSQSINHVPVLARLGTFTTPSPSSSTPSPASSSSRGSSLTSSAASARTPPTSPVSSSFDRILDRRCARVHRRMRTAKPTDPRVPTETNEMEMWNFAREIHPRATSRPRSRRANPVHPPRRPSSPAFGGSSVRFVVNSFVSLRSFHRSRTVASASKTAHSSVDVRVARETRLHAHPRAVSQSNQIKSIEKKRARPWMYTAANRS